LILYEGNLVYNSIDKTAAGETMSMLIRLTQAPEKSHLEAIPGIASVEQLENRQFRLQLTCTNTPIAPLAEQLVQQGWGLEEFTPEHPGLEQIFVKLTTGESTTP